MDSTEQNGFETQPEAAQASVVAEKELPVIERSMLRVVMLADEEVLHSYGPVLRRLAVGMLDEVGELTILCLGQSTVLTHVPSPPVRIVYQTKNYEECIPTTDTLKRQVAISAPRFEQLELVFPQRQARRLEEVLSPIKPTLLHALSEKQAPLAKNLSEMMEIPYVLSLLKQNSYHEKYFDENCRMILPCNSQLTRKLRNDHPELIPRIQQVPIGTHVPDNTCCFVRDDLKPQIFCCGNFEHRHGYPELINAAKKLHDEKIDFQLTLSGVGPAEHEIRHQVNQLGISELVNFVPPFETMVSASDAYKAILQSCDIFVQPWPGETWRPELLEAMSVGNAVVAADCDGHDLIIPGKTALNVGFHDEEALTDALRKLLTDHEYARTLGKDAQQFLRKHFLASRMIFRLTEAYQQALQGHLMAKEEKIDTTEDE